MWFPCSSFPLKMAYDFGNYKLLRNSVDGNLMLFQDKASVFKFIPRSLDQPKSFSWWRSRWERCRALLKLPIWCCVRWEKVLPARQFILTFFFTALFIRCFKESHIPVKLSKNFRRNCYIGWQLTKLHLSSQCPVFGRLQYWNLSWEFTSRKDAMTVIVSFGSLLSLPMVLPIQSIDEY